MKTKLKKHSLLSAFNRSVRNGKFSTVFGALWVLGGAALCLATGTPVGAGMIATGAANIALGALNRQTYNASHPKQ